MLSENQKKTKSIQIVIILAIILVLVFAIPALAQTDILNTSADRMSQTEIWWDKLWESTFNPPPISNGGETTNLSMYAFVQPTRFILGIGLIFWLFSYGYKILESKTVAQSIYTFIRIFIPIFVAVILLANQATHARTLAIGMRSIVNSWSEGVMNLQITDYSVRAAIQDQLITQNAKERLVEKVRTCESIEPPEVIIPSIQRPDTSDPNIPAITPAQRKVYDYLECWQKVKEYAQNELDIANEQRICGGAICKTYRKLADLLFGYTEGIQKLEEYKSTATDLNDPQVQQRIQEIKSRIQLSKTAFDISQGNTENLKNIVVSFVNPSKTFLYFTQWMWVSTLEMAMFLNALFSPIFVAVSIIPGRQNMLVFWLIENLTIGLAKMAYVIVIGIVAIQISSSDTGFLDDTFFMTLGIFAPAVSFAVVVTGGLAAASSFRNQSVGSVAAIGGLISGGAATIGYSMTRAWDKRR